MKPFLIFAAATLLMTPAAFAETTFAAQANALCRDIIDARDYQTFAEAKRQSLDFMLAKLQQHEAPSTEARNALATMLDAMHAEIASTQVKLMALATDYPQHADDLALFTKRGDYYLALFEARSAALKAPGALDFPSEHSIPDPFDASEWDAATIRLGFAQRDCNAVFFSNGNPPELANFVSVVAPACAMLYDDFIETDLETWRDEAFDALVSVRQGTPASPEAIPALKSLASTWAQAYHMFTLVDVNVVEKPPHWIETIGIFNDRRRIYRDRAYSLESGDQDAIDRAFGRRLEPIDFAAMGLMETSCMALGKLT